MRKSNIYVYYELSKMVGEFQTAKTENLKQTLKAKSAYFKIIEPKYFSEQLSHEWQSIARAINQKDLFEELSTADCLLLIKDLENLHQKVKVEIFDESLIVTQ